MKGLYCFGDTRLGLLWTCETLYNRSQVCYATSLGGAWLVTLGCVLLGCLCVTATIVLLALSHCRLSTSIMTYARWVGFSAMVLFCLAAVVFPMGFYVEEIGGEPYQLPNSFQIRVITGMQDVTIAIDNKILGSEFLLQVASELGIDDTQWLGLQYSDLHGRWWWLQDHKKVLAQKVRPIADPLIMFLKVRLYPPKPSALNDTTMQRLVFLQVQSALEVGELMCPSPRKGTLASLARQDSVLLYLETAEDLEEYGTWHFIVTRPHDPIPVRLSINLTGFSFTLNNRKYEFPFSEIESVKIKKRKLVLRHTSKAFLDSVFECPDHAHAKELYQQAVLHRKFYLAKNAC
ncbi:moesin-like isoform X2 [Scylla paramamosain]|uniref:moesin-like isoform X2 n=1 Tax=Scylla paramamosain TaxID=85552 RepID=UPI00308355CB